MLEGKILMKKAVRKIVIFGPQGSGKGTQAEIIAKRYGLSYLSTGVMIRKEITDKTPFGVKMEKYVHAGKLAPQGELDKIVEKYIKSKKVIKSGFILDGYPRNSKQKKFLDSITDITDVLVVNITDDEAVERIGGRLMTKSGKTFHKIYNPPPGDLKEEVFVRDDDKPKAIKERLKIYHKETEPAITAFEKQGLVKHIDGMGSIQEVTELVKKALDID